MTSYIFTLLDLIKQLAGVGAEFIALATITAQSLRASTASPAETLKSE